MRCDLDAGEILDEQACGFIDGESPTFIVDDGMCPNTQRRLERTVVSEAGRCFANGVRLHLFLESGFFGRLLLGLHTFDDTEVVIDTETLDACLPSSDDGVVVFGDLGTLDDPGHPGRIWKSGRPIIRLLVDLVHDGFVEGLFVVRFAHGLLLCYMEPASTMPQNRLKL